MATFFLPPLLAKRTGKSELDVVAATLEEAVGLLNSQFPGFRNDLCADAHSIRQSLTVVVDGVSVDTLDCPLKPDSKVDIVRLIAGG